MLIARSFRCVNTSMRGFTLIEMMVAIVIGMIVVGGAVALIVAINQANSETIQSTRLTQELQALASVIADDVKRARAVTDPIGMVSSGSATACVTAPTAPTQPCYPITPTAGSANCITYGYSGAASAGNVYNAGGVLTSSYLYNYRSIRLVTSGGVGTVNLSQLTFDPTTGIVTPPGAAGTIPTAAAITACPITGGAETAISSKEINITALTFTYVNSGEIDLSLTGKQLAGDTYTNNISRTFTQPIFIRSSQL